MNMLLWLWVVVVLVGAGMTVLAYARPQLKAAWWLALTTGWLLLLLWAAAFPATPKVLPWPGLWSPVLTAPGSRLTPWTWAAGLMWLATVSTGLSLTVALTAPPVAAPDPWRAWLLLAVVGLTALTATPGWALALAWAMADALTLVVEYTITQQPQERAAAWLRAGVRALFWAVPLVVARLPTLWQGPAWALAALGRAWAAPRVPHGTTAVFGHSGRWVFWMPWLVTLVPLLHEPLPPLPPWVRAGVTIVGVASGLRAGLAATPAARTRGWLTAGAALVVLAGEASPHAAQAWLLLLTIAGLGSRFLALAPDPWLAGGLAVLLAGPALLWPFTPTAVALHAWAWPPTFTTGALAVLHGLLVWAVWHHWPRQGVFLSQAPRGTQILVATGLLALPAVLWGVGLRLGWLTPPAEKPGWLPWLAGPVLAGLAGVAVRLPRGRAGPRGIFPRVEDLARTALGRALTGLESLTLFTTRLLEGEGGLFWALVALALAFLWWKGG